MKKNLLVLAVSGALVGFSGIASADLAVGVLVGSTSVSSSSLSLGSDTSTGFYLEAINDSDFSYRAAYTKLGDFKGADGTQFAADAIWHKELGDGDVGELLVIGGINWTNFKYDLYGFTSNGIPYTKEETDNSLGVALGAGYRYNINENFFVQAEGKYNLEVAGSDIPSLHYTTIGASVAYKF